MHCPLPVTVCYRSSCARCTLQARVRHCRVCFRALPPPLALSVRKNRAGTHTYKHQASMMLPCFGTLCDRARHVSNAAKDLAAHGCRWSVRDTVGSKTAQSEQQASPAQRHLSNLRSLLRDRHLHSTWSYRGIPQHLNSAASRQHPPTAAHSAMKRSREHGESLTSGSRLCCHRMSSCLYSSCPVWDGLALGQGAACA